MLFFFLAVALAQPQDPLPPDARLVVLGGSVAETVCALGACERIVAADASSTAPEELQLRANLGFHRQISAEGVLSVRPDVVLASPESGPPESLKQVERAGVRVVQVPGDATAEGSLDRIRFLGQLLGAPAKAHELTADLESRLQSVRERVEGSERPRVLFIYARGGGTMMVAGRSTAAGELIELAGGQNAVRGYEGYKPLTAEAVVMARPDVVLLTTGGLEVMGGARALWQTPGLAQTPASKDKRLIAVEDLLLLGFGPRLAEAVETVARGLHPERIR